MGRPQDSIIVTNRTMMLVATLLCLLITFVRWPEILLDAQFWGEDGWFWWPEARSLGLSSLWLPHTGYFQTDDRLVALLSALLPLTWGPTLFAGAAFVFEVLPPAFLISQRCAALCPSLPLRCFLALMWCALPNTWEVHGNLTNSQWHLALLSFLIVLSSPPCTRGAWTFDTLLLALSAVSGPFSILLVPIAALRAWQLPSRASMVRLALLAAGATLQAASIYLTQRGMPPLLGATPTNFVRLMAGQIMLGSLAGCLQLPYWYALGSWKIALLPWLLFLVGAWLCIDALRRWPVLRYAGLFTALMLLASLSHPVATPGTPVWIAMRAPNMSMRYLFIPLVFWVSVVVIQALGARWSWAKGTALVFLALMVGFGIPQDWRFEPEPNRNFYELAHQFDKAPPGTQITVPVRPGSQVTLTR